MLNSPATVLLLGTFDSKGSEFAYLRECLIECELNVITMNVGILGSTDQLPVDIQASQVTEAVGCQLQTLSQTRDRGNGIKVMGTGAAALALSLYERGRIQGVIGMGGSGGTGLVTSAMRALPLGVPKVCLSTVASGQVAPYVGIKDIVMIPSIVDVSGLNRILKGAIRRAAGVMQGLMKVTDPRNDVDRPLIAASMFGNTTACVDHCRQLLDQQGYETLIFHATGTGGRVLESLVSAGFVDGVLDITTTEWADEICGGIFSAGPERLDAAGANCIPHLIVPGCLDMCNFGPPDSVPQVYRDAGRQFYEWSPEVTLMRTNIEENIRLGEIFARKANAAKGPVALLIPLRGFSLLDGDGESFCNRETDLAFLDALKKDLDQNVPLIELDTPINSTEFAETATKLMLSLIQKQEFASTKYDSSFH
tara:strand:- start:2363 stop:3631 length:1269 start_codon:yes stop_codon:yes gene_type:complete